MADLSITAANFAPGANARFEQGFAGETITQGQAVYKASTGLWMKADANSATAAARASIGLAANGASLNQPITVQTSGQCTLGATMTANIPYFLSDTPGGICPIADVGSGEYGCLIGISVSTTGLDLVLKYTAAAN
jgi:hypothetical protein